MEVHNLYASPSIFPVIKSSSMRRERRVALMIKIGDAYNILAGRPKRKCPTGIPRRDNFVTFG